MGQTHTDQGTSAQPAETGTNEMTGSIAGIEVKDIEVVGLEILQKLNGPHEKARTQSPDTYPERQVTPEQTSFDDPTYKPAYFANPGIYKDDLSARPPWACPLPVDAAERDAYLDSLVPNPGGPTGIRGPGELGQNQNWAADPIAMTINPETGEIYMVQILRDIGEWAIPGGMVDGSETHMSAALREFFEETGSSLEEQQLTPKKLYQGYVDDYRNTDTHYMMSSVFMFVIPWDKAQEMKFSTVDETEGIRDRRLRALNQENMSNLFGSHTDLTKLALVEIGKSVSDYVSNESTQQKTLQRIREMLNLSS